MATLDADDLSAITALIAPVKAKTDYLPSVAPGALGGLFKVGANSPVTVDITGTITNATNVATVTNLTNAPTSGDLTATMKASVTAAVPASGSGVLDEATAGNVIVGSLGNFINALKSSLGIVS